MQSTFCIDLLVESYLNRRPIPSLHGNPDIRVPHPARQRNRASRKHGLPVLAKAGLPPGALAHAGEIKQISMVVCSNFVLTFQERSSGLFDPVRDRLRGSKGGIRELGDDYLAYSLIDTVVDRYFVVLDSFTDCAEDLEETVLHDVSPRLLHQTNRFKRETVVQRK